MLGSRRSARYPRKSCSQTISSSRRTRAGLEIDGGALSRSWSKLHLTLGQKFCHPVNSTCPILVTARHLFPLPSIASDTMGWKPFLKGEFSVLITCIFPRFCCAFFFKVQIYWTEGKMIEQLETLCGMFWTKKTKTVYFLPSNYQGIMRTV